MSSTGTRGGASGSGGYLVPARVHRVEEVIKRSRFITTLARAPHADAAHDFVQRIRDELPDATHHCWAFVAGPPGSTTSIGMSDAGEPHGTAGRPMLTMLLYGEVGEVVAVSTRYYGGTKLGTGGLSRAYSGGVKAALESLPTEVKTPRKKLEVVVGYPHVDGLQRLLDDFRIERVAEEYGADVRYRLAVPVARVEAFTRAVADLTGGEGTVRPG